MVGKTTLCNKLKAEPVFDYFSLDNPMERRMAIEDPALFLEMHRHPLIIDEVQYAPVLFETIDASSTRRWNQVMIMACSYSSDPGDADPPWACRDRWPPM